nr:hypothetical protein SUP05_FGYC13J70027 [uncultured Candidatus Thioglobus sp.]
MFTNVVTTTIEFDYQGQHYDLKTVIDIDHIIHHEDFFNSVYTSVARANNIGAYSYQLEVMLDQDIHFSNEKGCVVGCVIDGSLDLNLLRESYQKAECIPKVELIMNQHIPKDQHSEILTKALTAAYLLGKSGN